MADGTQADPIVVPLGLSATWVVVKGIFNSSPNEVAEFMKSVTPNILEHVQPGQYFTFSGSDTVYLLLDDHDTLMVTRPGAPFYRGRVQGYPLERDGAGANSPFSPSELLHQLKDFLNPLDRWDKGE